MISRVADHCFWFGRYIDRAESTARVMGVTLNLALDGELTPRQCWLPAIIVSGEEEEFHRRFGVEAADDGEAVQRYMTWDEQNLTCIRQSIFAARDNARSIREVVSLEAWEEVNELYLWICSDVARALYHQHRYGFYRHVRRGAQLILGLLRSTMLHDTPLDFIWLGVLLERVGQTARTLDVHHHALTSMPRTNPILSTALWLSLLRSCSGFEPFMKRNQAHVTANGVAGFLLLEPQFPRSVRYCVHSAFQRLCDIRPPEDKELPGGMSLERLHALESWLGAIDKDALDPDSIHATLTHVVDETAAICELIGRELLGYSPPSPSSEPVASVESAEAVSAAEPPAEEHAPARPQ